MKERKTVRQFTISADIYDMELPQKIQAALYDNLPDIQPELYYGIDLTFDTAVYSVPAFFQYPLDKRPLAPPGAQQTKEEKGKAILSAILTQQLEKIVQQVEALGFAVDNAGIEGVDFSDLHRIDIRLFESAEKEYTKQGTLMKHYKVFNIMPDRPYLMDDAAQKLARLFHEQVKKGALKQMEFERHTPHFLQADEVFSAVAEAILSEEGNEDEAAVLELAGKLLTQAVIKSDWPLDIKSGANAETEAAPLERASQIDCPEYLLYHAFQGGSWNLYKIDGLQSAREIITTGGYNVRKTARIIILHNLRPVPFTLFEETKEGLVMLDKKDAAGKKKLQVSWNQ